MATGETLKAVVLRIKRRENRQAQERWEEFEIPYKPGMNVISCLMEIQRNPVTREGKSTTPVAWDSNCLEEVCGACSMIVNGRVRQACTALVDRLHQNGEIELQPMSKFPLVRDLVVDREVMFESLKRVRAWVPIDGTYALGPGPRVSAETQGVAYVLSTCMTCGCCLEACPQINESSDFIGAAAINQVRLFNMHPSGAMHKADRLRALMLPGGVQDCGKAQNCVAVCPKEIPLTDSISEMMREVSKQALKDVFGAGAAKKAGGPG